MKITKRFFVFGEKLKKEKAKENNKLLEDNSERKMQFQFNVVLFSSSSNTKLSHPPK
jgi:hypothetical protein